MSQSRSEIFVSIPSPLPMVFFLCTRVDRSLRMRLITSWPWPRPPAAAAEDGSGDPENDLLGSRGGLLFSSSYFLLGRVQLLCLPTAATVFHLREEGKIANNFKINLSKSCPLSQRSIGQFWQIGISIQKCNVRSNNVEAIQYICSLLAKGQVVSIAFFKKSPEKRPFRHKPRPAGND